jgi:hypothetical protein
LFSQSLATPGHQSRFVLTVESQVKVEIAALKEEHMQWKETLLQGRWSSSKEVKRMFEQGDQVCLCEGWAAWESV